ncbi:MAG TPA: replication-relaxation family protein [Nitrospiraceae bacterium]|nr:replication-relaxation family protein [Nitrospiraceae bacterium]
MALQTDVTATGKRLSKFRRIENAVPHVLTDRDMAIIAAVADYRLLSRSQIQRLLGFGTVTRVNFRLQKLFHHGYLARHFLLLFKGSSQAIYTLDRLGLPVAAERLGKDVATLWRPKEMLSPLFLTHELALNDVRMAFELAARAHNDHQVVTWRAAEETKDRFFFGGSWYTLTPDALLRYRVGKQLLSAFIEVDRGTMPNRRFQRKVEVYFAYDVSGRLGDNEDPEPLAFVALSRASCPTELLVHDRRGARTARSARHDLGDRWTRGEGAAHRDGRQRGAWSSTMMDDSLGRAILSARSSAAMPLPSSARCRTLASIAW